MKATKTHYHVLQVQPDADQEVVDAAYRRLCKKHHPDVNPGLESEVRIRLLNDAYHVLGDPAKRSAYDRHLTTATLSTATREEFGMTGAEARTTADEQATEAATQLLKQYFEALKEKQVYQAYRLLTDEDRSRVSSQDFLDWQEAVGELFQIGDIQLSIFRTHRQMGVVKRVDLVAEGMEIDLVRNTITEFKTVKSAIYNGKSWQVVLGYEEVKGLAAKFRLMAQSQNPRLLDEETLLVMLEQEIYRAKRFGENFSLVLMQVKPTRGMDAVGMWEAKILSWVSEAINHMRVTDMLSHRARGNFLLLLPHTNQEQAQSAAAKIKALLMKQAELEGSEVLIETLVSPFVDQQASLWVTQMAHQLKHFS